MNIENQKPNDDRSQNDPQPEVGASIYQSFQSMGSDPEETSYKLSWQVGEETWAYMKFI